MVAVAKPPARQGFSPASARQVIAAVPATPRRSACDGRLLRSAWGMRCPDHRADGPRISVQFRPRNVRQRPLYKDPSADPIAGWRSPRRSADPAPFGCSPVSSASPAAQADSRLRSPGTCRNGRNSCRPRRYRTPVDHRLQHAVHADGLGAVDLRHLYSLDGSHAGCHPRKTPSAVGSGLGDGTALVGLDGDDDRIDCLLLGRHRGHVAFGARWNQLPGGELRAHVSGSKRSPAAAVDRPGFLVDSGRGHLGDGELWPEAGFDRRDLPRSAVGAWPESQAAIIPAASPAPEPRHRCPQKHQRFRAPDIGRHHRGESTHSG